MSGHSKWSQIKRQKESTDKKKGKLFSKLTRAITLAVREKGDNPNTNFQLRLAIEKAKTANMPQANVKRAIKKGTGEIEGGKIEEILYEAYGPGGIAILIRTLSDNRNRTTSEVRSLLTKYGGRLGEANSVKWLFEEKGVIKIISAKNKEEIVLFAIESGASDIEESKEEVIILTTKDNLNKVKTKLESKYPVEYANIEMVPKSLIYPKEDKERKKLDRLLEGLEDIEDVDNIFTNIKDN